MKKISLVLILVISLNFILPLLSVSATTYGDVVAAINNRTMCSIGEYEVAMIKNDGVITKVGCYATYDAAKPVMNGQTSTITNVATIIKYISTTNKEIIDARYGMLYLKTKPDRKHNTDIYSSPTATSESNYFNGYYGTDAPLLDYDNNAPAVKMKLSGYTGWLKKIDSNDGHLSYTVVPISLAKAPTYYYVNTNNELVHKLTDDITDANAASLGSYYLGPAPTFMKKDVKYYSFDGNYFYTDILKMLNDYKNNGYAGTINALDPYYNYYQYLPYRTKTLYTSTDINEYIQSRGYTQKPLAYSDKMPANQSMLYAEGPNYIDSQEKFGANALLTFALSINESGWGRSYISVTNKNIFGHGAYDYDPAGSANSYSDVKYSIYYHADEYVSFGYADPADYRYNGSHFGNKASGMNVKYASDPYWSEKMVSNYYQFDNALGMQDYKLYEIGLKKTTSAVNVRKEPNSSSTTIYQLKSGVVDVPVVILGEVTGEAIDGNTKWYKIQSDPLLDVNRVPIADPTSGERPTYNWTNNYAYVHSSSIDIIGEETQYAKKGGSFYLDKFSWDSTSQTINFRGYLSVLGVNNTLNLPASYSLILKDVNDSTKEYIIPLDRWGNKSEFPFQIPNQYGYDYSGSWFNANISLKDIPQGDYVGYIRARINKSETTAILRNMFSTSISNKVTDSNGRGYLFRTNYYIKDITLEIFIRDNGLISNVPAPTRDNMLNSYSSIDFNNNNLNIKGTSFNIKGNYATDQTVERKIILENTTTYERYEFASNYIDNGDYKIVLRVPDGFDKTRAWFNSSIDVTTLPEGRYAIYIKTKSGSVEDYGELNDIFVRELNKQITLGNKIYKVELNKDKRMRLELVVSLTGTNNDATTMLWDTNGIQIKGWAYSTKADPNVLTDITHQLVFTNTTDSTRQAYDLDSVETCSISSIGNCQYHNDYVGYIKTIDLRAIPNGKYLISIETKVRDTDTYSDKLLSTLDMMDKLSRAKIGNDEKLLTFSYEDTGMYLNVESFTYEYDIAIDVGHYGSDSGTYNSTMIEQALNFEVSSYEKQRYEEHGLKVWMNKSVYNGTPTLLVDNDWSLLHRAAYSFGYQAVTSRIAYSNHHNGSYPSASGFEIICPATYNLTQLSTEKTIHDEWAKITSPSTLYNGFYTRDAYSPYGFYPKYDNQVYSNMRTYYAIIRIPFENFNVKSILYEPAYMTNATNFDWYYTQQNWKKMAELKIKYYVQSLGKVYDGKYDTL
jgi:beta-N-acetylglucosaminidase/N-acetylmuramoyl-L-alanine amidase